jgi:hypothetical protein
MADSSSSIDTADSESIIDGNEVAQNKYSLMQLFSSKELCLYKMVSEFYKKCSKEHVQKIIDIVDGKSNISLRILDWFVTKYSKKKQDIKIDNGIDYYDVRIDYKAVLKSYKKRNFDPFRRRKKFKFYFDKEHKLELITTLGQLNFFQWAIKNNIIKYVNDHLDEITKEMNLSNKEEKLIKKNKKNVKQPANQPNGQLFPIPYNNKQPKNKQTITFD